MLDWRLYCFVFRAWTRASYSEAYPAVRYSAQDSSPSVLQGERFITSASLGTILDLRSFTTLTRNGLPF